MSDEWEGTSAMSDEWEPNWCAACGNIAVTRSGAVCDICINEQAAFTELVQLGQEIEGNNT